MVGWWLRFNQGKGSLNEITFDYFCIDNYIKTTVILKMSESTLIILDFWFRQ